jgi:hypothetical protein
MRNYMRRMPPETAEEYTILAAGLSALVCDGRLGRKNGRGLICGEAWGSPLPKRGGAAPQVVSLRLLYLFINACYNSLAAREMTAEALTLALRSLFQSEKSLEDVVRSEGRENIRNHLNARHAETALSYFRCAPGLKDEP